MFCIVHHNEMLMFSFSYPTIFNEPFGKEGLLEGMPLSWAWNISKFKQKWEELKVYLFSILFGCIRTLSERNKHWGMFRVCCLYIRGEEWMESRCLCVSLVGLFRGFHGWAHPFRSAWWDSGEWSDAFPDKTPICKFFRNVNLVKSSWNDLSHI